MRFEIFDELNEGKNLAPEFNVAINGRGDDKVMLVGSENIVDDVAMHVTDLVVFG